MNLQEKLQREVSITQAIKSHTQYEIETINRNFDIIYDDYMVETHGENYIDDVEIKKLVDQYRQQAISL